LLEAVTQVVVDQTRVLLVAYDAPYPPPLFVKRPIPEAFGVALVLAPVGTAVAPAGRPALASMRAAAAAGSASAVAAAGSALPPSLASLGLLTLSFSDSPADRMGDAALESLRASIPAARSLPLLYQLAVRRRAVVNIDYLDGRCVAVEIDPCA
jgi:hypothetical protein